MAPPTEIIARIPDLTPSAARMLAHEATKIARAHAPKLTGASAKRITATWGKGYFGVKWQDSYLWFQEAGIKAFTMNKLAGKTIPMWIDDPTGKERRKNPKAKTRVTASGKQQVLIFRKAGRKGDMKKVKKKDGSFSIVPSTNYPGGPGRIANREARRPHTRQGKVAGQVARQNVGVSWRFPGMRGRHFLLHGVTLAALLHGYVPVSVVSRGPDGERPVDWNS